MKKQFQFHKFNRSEQARIALAERYGEPVLALLVDGVVRVDEVGGAKLVAAVHGGYFSVDSDIVAILAETAELASEIDVARAQRAIDRAVAAGADDAAEIAAVVRGETRLRAAMSHQQATRH